MSVTGGRSLSSNNHVTRDQQGSPLELETWAHGSVRPGSGNIHGYNYHIDSNSGDGHGNSGAQTSGDGHGNNSAQNSGDGHGNNSAQNSGDGHGNNRAQNSGHGHGTSKSQNSGHGHGISSAQNSGHGHGIIRAQNSGHGHGTSRAQSLAGTMAQRPNNEPEQYHNSNHQHSNHKENRASSRIPSDYESASDDGNGARADEEGHYEDAQDETRPPPLPRQPHRHKHGRDIRDENIVIDIPPLSPEEEVKQRTRSTVVFSCFVFFCCNAFCGAAAFLVAMSSRDAKVNEARRLGNIALGMNVFGIIISWVMVSIVVGLWYFGVIYIPFAPWRIQHVYGTT